MDTFRKVTMAEVARRAGVSRAAVTAAFSDRPTTVGLNPATRALIHKAAEELGYRPNILSRSFIKQKSYLIGMLGREVFFLFALETLKGIEDILEPTDFSLLTFYNGSWSEDQAKHLQKGISRRVDGIIIVGAPERPDGPNHQLIKELQASGLPVVQIYRRVFPGVPVVMMDEEQAVYQMTRHLIELGHRRIAHVTYSGYRDEDLPGTEIEAKLRAEGYLRAIHEAGLQPSILTFDRTSPCGPGSNDYTRWCTSATAELLDGAFTAATTFNDYTAIALLHNLADKGVKVPDDVSLAGFDNIEACALMRPSITTVRPKLLEIGHRAGKMILQMLEKQPVQDVVLAPELVFRGSTGPCPKPA